MKLTPAAATSTSTSPAPGSGAGRCSTASTSMPPWRGTTGASSGGSGAGRHPVALLGPAHVLEDPAVGLDHPRRGDVVEVARDQGGVDAERRGVGEDLPQGLGRHTPPTGAREIG